MWKLDPLASMKNSGLRTKYWILNHSKLIEQSGVAVSEQTHLNPYFSQLQSYWKGFALDNFGIFFYRNWNLADKDIFKKIKLYFVGTSCFAILYISFFSSLFLFVLIDWLYFHNTPDLSVHNIFLICTLEIPKGSNGFLATHLIETK